MDDKCFDILEKFLDSKDSAQVVFKSYNVFTDNRSIPASEGIVSLRRKLANRIGRRVSRGKVWAFRGYNITLYGSETNPRKYLAVLDLDQLVEIYVKAIAAREYSKARKARLKVCILLKISPESFYPLKGFYPLGAPSYEEAKQLIQSNIKGICPLGCGVFYEDKDKLRAHIKFVIDTGVDDTLRDKAKDLLDGVDV